MKTVMNYLIEEQMRMEHNMRANVNNYTEKPQIDGSVERVIECARSLETLDGILKTIDTNGDLKELLNKCFAPQFLEITPSPIETKVKDFICTGHPAPLHIKIDTGEIKL